ncbi:elongation factor P 5-aminopentanone reductase [Candidatus Epulonipiscium viviparus]|uniref:elongation factor P 5-aminopentanone reductase n=1 Tax=Candidatus Epulonipiscium viviparus TaxID=420336 RepID=UPI00016BFF16|nr:3-oxoacyl-ACP reductase FabG [Candidatus Epulopiscium viviparus]
MKNKIVLVTGSSRGIGKAIANAFLKQGDYVILNSGNSEEELIQTYEEFMSRGYPCTYYKADLAIYKEALSLFDFIVEKTGSYPDVVINNAGISYYKLFTETKPNEWTKVINTNLNSAYHCSYLALPYMIKNHSGIIINISSIWGSVGASLEVAYSTSKSALHGFTKALAKEVGPSNIRINAIACGWIDTGMNNLFDNEDRAIFLNDVPLMRAGSVTDVAKVCLFLASDNASYITGQIITLDGGLT